MDEFDRILSSEALLEPTPDLALRVLAEVQREAARPAPLSFPWRRVAAAAALITLASSGAAAMPAVREPTRRVLESLGTAQWLVAGGLLGTLAIVVATLWVAARAD